MDSVRKSKKSDKSLITKLCSVCGDSALSCNFGAVTCESCKAFFRRNAHKGDSIEECLNNCTLTRQTRSYCKSCRLQKCFAVGMDKNLIWTDEDKEKRKRKIEENKQKRIRTDDDGESTMDTQLNTHADPNSFQGAFINSLKQKQNSKIKSKIPFKSTNVLHSVRNTNEKHSAVSDTQENRIFVKHVHKDESPNSKQTSVNQSLPNIGTLISPYQNSPNTDGHPSSVDRSSADSLDSDGFFSDQSGKFTSNDEDVHDNKYPVQCNTDYVTVSGPASGIDSNSANKNTGFNQPNVSEYNDVYGDNHSLYLSDDSGYIQNTNFNVSVSHSENMDNLTADVRSNELVDRRNTPYSQSIPTDILQHMEPHLVDHTLQLLRACEISFDKVIVQEIKQEPDLADSFNQLEGFIKKTVLFAKNLPAFSVLSQSDQLSLVKGAFLEVMCVWFFQLYNPETRSFRVLHKQPNNQQDIVVTHTKVGSALSIVEEGNKLITGYESLLREYMHISKGDPAIGMCLIAHILFIQRSHLTYTNAEHIQYYSDMYMKILMSYTNLAYPNGEVSLSELVDLVPKIIKNCGITQEALDRAPVSDLTPFTKELFNKW